MIKGLFAFIGFLALIAGLGLGGYLLLSTQNAQKLDGTQQKTSTTPGAEGGTLGNACVHPKPIIEISSKTMAENDTQALHVHLSNPGKKACVTTITVDAPNFDLGNAPATKKITVPAKSKTTDTAWIISPKKVGTFQVTVQSGSDVAIAGVTVLNVLGLSALQIQIFSIIATFFGPMLSAPWWLEQLRNRKSKR